MTRWMQRLRGAVGVGLTWGAAWLLAGLALLVVVGPHAADVPFPLFFGLLGFLAGTAFAGILGAMGRHRRFDELSVGHFAAWGAVGGSAVALLVDRVAGPGNLLVLLPVFATASAISAAGSLAVARWAERRTRSEV